MAYDPQSKGLILLGGLGDRLDGGTWRFDGTQWTRLAPPNSPRQDQFGLMAEMAYDHRTSRIVLVGVTKNGDANTDTWDGADWTIPQAPVCPSDSSCRHDAVLTFEPGGGRLILAGGLAQGGSSDTDAWDGTSWSHLTTTTQPPAAAFYGATDSQRGAVIATTCSGDTWTFRGGNWIQLRPTHGPPSMAKYGRCSVAYDAALKKIVLVGVPDAGSASLTVWTWDGTDWTAAP